MERREPVSDREIYPALWITLACLSLAVLVWLGLGRPTIAGCWFYRTWQVYCPGCGGTRAVEALARGDLLTALRSNPAVPYLAVTVGAYLLSQTVWRLRRRTGWVLRYHPGWMYLLLAILAVNCLVRNLLWLGFGIPI